MATTTSKRILLKVNGAERPIFEAKANAALTPGELLAWSADDELDPHGTAGGNAQPMFCVENPYDDDNTVAAIDSDYALADTARYVVAQPGDEVYAFIAAGESVAKGDPLESDGAGALQAHTAPSIDESGTATTTIYHRAIVGWAAEDKDNSGGGSRVRIRVSVA